jgi:predicted house-cleaning noncanonical NTP pyrophosphatase (MazG superfamily)
MKADKTMDYDKKLTRKEVLEEVAKFQKNMEELRLIRNVINDIRNYRRMIQVRRYD